MGAAALWLYLSICLLFGASLRKFSSAFFSICLARVCSQRHGPNRRCVCRMSRSTQTQSKTVMMLDIGLRMSTYFCRRRYFFFFGGLVWYAALLRLMITRCFWTAHSPTQTMCVCRANRSHSIHGKCMHTDYFANGTTSQSVKSV